MIGTFHEERGGSVISTSHEKSETEGTEPETGGPTDQGDGGTGSTEAL
jgi:hypothetical protein